MAAIAKAGTPSLATITPPQSCRPHTGSIAGEDLAAGDLARLHTDGLYYRANGAALNDLAKVKGIVATAASAGEAVTIYSGVTFHYGAGMSPGTPVFVSPSVLGGLDTANATVNIAVGYVLDATRIYVGPPRS